MMHFTESKYEPMMQESLRYKPPGKCFILNTGWGVAVTSEELLKRLQEYHGIVVDKKTAHNYARYEWILAPKIINKGRAGGRLVDYEETASAEFVASYRLKREKKAKKENVALARKIAKEESGADRFWTAEIGVDLLLLAQEWRALYNQALDAEDPEMKMFHDETSRLLASTRDKRRALRRREQEELSELFKDSDEQVERGSMPITEELISQWRGVKTPSRLELDRLIVETYQRAAEAAFTGQPEEELRKREKIALLPKVICKHIDFGDE